MKIKEYSPTSGKISAILNTCLAIFLFGMTVILFTWILDKQSYYRTIGSNDYLMVLLLLFTTIYATYDAVKWWIAVKSFNGTYCSINQNILRGPALKIGFFTFPTEVSLPLNLIASVNITEKYMVINSNGKVYKFFTYEGKQLINIFQQAGITVSQ